MTLSVLTLVKNRETHLANLVDGLNRSTIPAKEFVVVDMSDEPVKRPGTGIPTRVIRLQRDGLPLAEARNLAARHASSDYLLFLDVDCIPSRDLIAAMLPALRANDALICASIRYLAAGDVSQDWTEEDLARRGQFHPVRPFADAGLQREDNAGLFWSLAFGIRKATFDALGGFDESFVGYGAEDTDFGFRARDAGVPLLFMGGPGAFHQHHAVHRPPLQNFGDILRNAATFHRRWHFWPMEGWLTEFESMGLIARTSSDISILRLPTSQQVNAAKSTDQRF
ncbi:MAG: glycosyltransferase [Hyphomicrobiaceae bacterium]|nr:glycosyltransferase [Hyphomicrobiaceae bacterium]